MMIPNQDFHSLQHQCRPPPPPPPPLPLQQHHHQHHPSLPSHFHLLLLVERLAEAVSGGNRDQQYEALVTELTTQFKRCQQLLDSISETLSTKSMTVEEQKIKLEETTQQLNQRRDLAVKYRSHVEEMVKPQNNR